VVQVLDWSASSATAAIVAKYEYDPYGNVVAQAAPTPSATPPVQYEVLG
jgi:YD repeat-containing protein